MTAAGCDPSSPFGPLKAQWTAQGDAWPIAAKAAVGNSRVYVGSWHGYEYAYDESTGAINWKTNLGTTQADCYGTQTSQGVTSSPALDSGNAYLGGGDSNWYALNALTGATLWTVPTGDNSATGGHYNWSSPALYNGHAYVGIASFCDSPLVQGELLRVNLSTGQVDNVFKTVPDGQVGGSIWTNPVVDPARSEVFVTTGNRSSSTQQYAEAMIGLDATTLAVLSYWTLPLSDPTPNADWGTSPVLFTDSSGKALVAAVNKNGILYAFGRDNLGSGPVWQTQIARGGPCPVCGDGSVSTGVFDGQNLYFAGGATTIGGTSYGGSVRAFNPTTGAVVWERGLGATVLGALAEANGMLVVPVSNGNLYVLNAANGAVLYANGLTGAQGADAIFAAPTIADGDLFIGTTDGVVHTFAFPSTIPQSSAARAASSRPRVARVGRSTCSLARASVECQLALTARCEVLGTLPDAPGGVVVSNLAVRRIGRGRVMPVALRLFTNRTCAGPPALRLRLAGRGEQLHLGRGWKLPPGSVISVAASREARIALRALGRRGETRPPAQSGGMFWFSRKRFSGS